MVLSYDSYDTLVKHDIEKILTFENEIGNLKIGMYKAFLFVQQNSKLISIKPEILEKIIK